MKVTEEIIADIKAKNPNVAIEQVDLVLDDGQEIEVIIKKPSNASISMYLSTMGTAQKEKKDLVQVNTKFVVNHILFPSQEKYLELAEKLPLMSAGICDELLSGVGLVKESKKKSL